MMLARFRVQSLMVTLAALTIGTSVSSADTYKIDGQHTEVRFTWDHLGLSRQGGRFTAVEGTVEFDPDKPAATKAEIKIPLKSIATGIKRLDEHLTNTKDFFDATSHPTITFKSTVVRVKSDKTAEMDGDLAINGITKPVTLEVIWNFSGEHPLQAINPVYAGAYASGFSATTQIRRSDWGITRTIPYVSDEVRITIETELLRTKVAEPAAEALPAPDTQSVPDTDAATADPAKPDDSPQGDADPSLNTDPKPDLENKVDQ
jgi:polyisoprenoid-binding protein YceI